MLDVDKRKMKLVGPLHYYHRLVHRGEPDVVHNYCGRLLKFGTFLFDLFLIRKAPVMLIIRYAVFWNEVACRDPFDWIIAFDETWF